MTDLQNTPDRARRRAIAWGVILLLILVQVGTRLLETHDRGHIGGQLVVPLVFLPLQLLGLSAVFAWAGKRRFGSMKTMIAGAIVAVVMGAALGLLLAIASHSFVFLQPRNGEWRPVRAMVFGVLWGEASLGYWALAFVFPFAVEDARVRSLEAETFRLEADKLRTAAELARLRAHLEPHFMLNTLNAIAGLVTDNPREARRLLVCLGDLLRDALRDEDEMQTLDEQIAWLRRYAEILETRHAGNLVFRWQIANDTKNVRLPRLLLQPLVENAVKHGALRRENGGEVTVRAEMADDTKLVCTIEDNGPGTPEGDMRSGAFGLHAVRRRLELRYPERSSLRLESSSQGTRSIVELPRYGTPVLAAAQ